MKRIARWTWHFTLWDAPRTGGWVWFDSENLGRCSCGYERKDRKLWWAVFGFSGLLYVPVRECFTSFERRPYLGLLGLFVHLLSPSTRRAYDSSYGVWLAREYEKACDESVVLCGAEAEARWLDDGGSV